MTSLGDKGAVLPNKIMEMFSVSGKSCFSSASSTGSGSRCAARATANYIMCQPPLWKHTQKKNTHTENENTSYLLKRGQLKVIGYEVIINLNINQTCFHSTQIIVRDKLF